jgi:hypothetical protein
VRDHLDQCRLAVQRAESLGVDASDLRAEVASVEEGLVETRARIHAFSVADMEASAKKSVASADSTAREADRLAGEARSRRRWLLSSTAVLLVIMATLALKIRSLDRS